MASTSGAPTQGDLRAEVLRLSAEQAERFAVRGSPVLFECDAYYPLRRMGVNPKLLNKSEADCWLRITEDGMATCTMRASGELVWSAHLDLPNEWKFSGVSFVFARVGDHVYKSKRPFVANLSADIDVIYVGFFKMFRGFRQRGELKRFLRARQAQLPPPPDG